MTSVSAAGAAASGLSAPGGGAWNVRVRSTASTAIAMKPGTNHRRAGMSILIRPVELLPAESHEPEVGATAPDHVV